MREQNRCANEMCSCTVADGRLYCDDYCAQAVAQGIERNYCQCAHEHVAPMFTPAYPLTFSREHAEATAPELLEVR